MNVFYKLDENGVPVPCDMGAFGKVLADDRRRRVAASDVGEVRISTIFTGYDMGFGDGHPLLWETMIFGGRHSRYRERYTSREDALIGHAQAVALVEAEHDQG